MRPWRVFCPLREVIAEKMQALYGATYHPEKEITVTSGGTQAIYTAITALVKEGDEVVIFEPAYDCYVPAIELAGGVPVRIPLDYPDYKIDWEQVKKQINSRTRIILINTPHNPTGAVWTRDDMLELEKISSGTDIVILSDEVYEHILFDGLKHESVCKFPGLASRSFIVFSFGKTYHTTGWKMGYCLAPEALMTEFRKCHQFVVFCSSAPMQVALAEYMKQKDKYLDLPKIYQQKRDYFLKLLAGSEFIFTPASGSYFQLLNYAKISDEKDTDFAVRLTRESGVASIPVSVFYNHPHEAKVLRFCFAKTNETLEKAAERLLSLKK
jgi:methionine aminotransferase